MRLFPTLSCTTEIFSFLLARNILKIPMDESQSSIPETIFTITVLEPVALFIGQNSTEFIMVCMECGNFRDVILLIIYSPFMVRGDVTKVLG